MSYTVETEADADPASGLQMNWAAEKKDWIIKEMGAIKAQQATWIDPCTVWGHRPQADYLIRPENL